MHPPRDHHLPPDPAAYRRAAPERGRVIVIAPTRAACETIELALGTEVETLLQRKHGSAVYRWAADGKPFGIVAGADTLSVDEIHQTSAELELCLALGKRAVCRFIWLSATVDPAFYARYLDSAEVLETSAFDPALRARVTVIPKDVGEFLDDRFVRHVIRERRGVAVVVPP